MISERVEMPDTKYCKRDVLQSIINAYSDAFDENQKNDSKSLHEEIEICNQFSSRIALQIKAKRESIGKYAIPCYDRLSKRVNKLKDGREIIDRSIHEIKNNTDFRIVMILESPGRCEYSGVFPGKENVRPQPANVEKGEGEGEYTVAAGSGVYTVALSPDGSPESISFEGERSFTARNIIITY